MTVALEALVGVVARAASFRPRLLRRRLESRRLLGRSLGSIYDFAERPLRGLLEELTERFELSAKYGWPAFWRPAPYPQRPVEVELDEAYRLLTERSVKCIELSSSYGMSGWVIAANVREEICSG